MEFVTLYRPHRIEEKTPRDASLEEIAGGYVLKVKLSDGRLTALLGSEDGAVLKAGGLESKGPIKVELRRVGKDVDVLELEEHQLN